MGTTGEETAYDVADLRRRADELAVLNDLARRLAALHDTRDVLDEVARQARRLLVVDVAYIMLLRTDVLRIEVVDGAMGSAMRGIELRSGQGLGGQVLSTGRPLWSEAYLVDDRFPRTPGTESAAQSEQLGGILGVPLVVGEEILGVLLAADRRPRAFVDHDVELLAGLAAHAALALRTADLFDRERTAAAELRTAIATLREVSESRQRASDLRDVLDDVVIRGGGLPAVVAALERSAGILVEVRDHEGRTLAGERSPEGGPVVPVNLPSGHAGDLVASPTTTPGEESDRLLRIGATTVAVLLASERSVTEAELRTRGEFVHALLSSEADEASLLRRARAIGIELGSVATVAVVDPEPVGTTAATAFAARLAAEVRGWSAAHAGQVVVLLPAGVEDVRDVVARLSGADGTTPTTGLAAGTGGPSGVRTAHEEARQTAALLLALDRPGVCATSEDLGLYRSLFSRAGRGEIAAFVRTTVGPLLDHDRERQRDLTVTLETYLEQARHHARTCEVLHIHANTLYQRLDRVTALLGPGWKDPGRALELQVALRLHRLMDTPST
ncbi:helix-turn-helix domain-containing protein [Nocardioides oleivorans]|uniref:helix-turn-helix domain-containing protein n=1 Tax=Nocardioides oleivorans TaxID=273676 RepID=UPI0013EA7451|nr:GAF domain-containing protein [Nocardioides oleivorans]